MKRPWQVWTLFAAAGLAAIAGMAWLSHGMVESDRELTRALAERERQQRINQAVWRMDGQLAPLVAEEIARPVDFYAPPQPMQTAVQAAEPPAPYTPPHVVTYFELDLADGRWLSPAIDAASREELATLSHVAFPEDLTRIEESSPQQVAEAWPPLQAGSLDEQYANAQQQPKGKGDYTQSKLDDFRQRQDQLRRNTRQEISKSQRAQQFDPELATPIEPMAMKPLWADDRLLLVRRTERKGRSVVQGAWLDWPALKAQLLSEVQDLVPAANLLPVSEPKDVDFATLLASLPVALEFPEEPVVTTIRPPTRMALAIGWGAVVLAIAAVGLLLRGVLALSERRAAFVSSVTHELRTPLTTFRMYAEMLAGDMIPSAERRREYLQTLQIEADRLTHLVDNVLAYARLERGRRPQLRDRVSVIDLVARTEPRLAERLSRADMQLRLDVSRRASEMHLLTDIGVVEQIVLNLVDNAAKYASSSQHRHVLLSVAPSERGKTSGVQFQVRDFGPGFPSTRTASRTLAFGKSAEQAAESAPGVGLGLALCRRLAREIGGRLTIGPCPQGACVSLWLPAEEQR